MALNSCYKSSYYVFVLTIAKKLNTKTYFKDVKDDLGYN
jgi:hypothetical protein